MKVNLQEHLAQEHKMSPVSTYLKEIVYGGSDGIVTTFAVVAGFAGAQNTSTTYPILVVLLFGLANLAADGASMGLSNFLSLRSEQDLYNLERKRELHEIRTNSKFEREETIHILMHKGYGKQDAAKLADMYRKNETYWADFMMNHELELPNPSGENPILTGLATSISFIIFGFVPLFPYIFLRNAPLFLFSCLFTFAALLILGIIRWQVTKHTIIRSVGEIVLLGGVSAVLAFIVGSFFRI